ncbi:hypothetical protein AMTRI_Chr12g271430 [Amborella trichopoda]
MRLVFVCNAEEHVVGKHVAPRNCPYCSETMQATDVESSWRFYKSLLSFYYKLFFFAQYKPHLSSVCIIE